MQASRSIHRGEVLASFPLRAPDALIDAVASAYGLARVGDTRMSFIAQRIVRFTFPPSRAVERVRAALQADPRVLFAQPNFVYSLSGGGSGGGGSSLPARQYVLERLSMFRAHAIATGRGVSIAIIDTGIDVSHPVLAGRVVATFDAIGQGRDGGVGAHGTAMASLIIGHGALTGVAPAGRLLSVRAFWQPGPGARPTSSSMALLKGTGWAIEAGARILNLSFSGPNDPLFGSVLATAARRGVIAVAAAGNRGPRAPPAYPAAYAHVVAVTATDRTDALYAKANRGAYIALAAPGVDVLAARPGGAFALVTGTSAASAHVSGVIALLVERWPGLAPKALLARLTASARDLGRPGRDPMFGYGLVDPLGALGSPPAIPVSREPKTVKR